MQETLLAALAGAVRFERRASLKTWLLSILKYKIIDAIRAKSRMSTLVSPAPSMDEDRTDDPFEALFDAAGLDQTPNTYHLGFVLGPRINAGGRTGLTADSDFSAQLGWTVLGVVLFIVGAALSAMLAFVSVAVFLPVAVFTWGEPLSILLLWIGWILGGAFTFLIGRYLGRPVVQWLTAEALLARLERHVGPSTPFSLVLLFQFALPSEIPGYVLGLVRYSFAKYLLALGLVELFYAVLMVEIGAGFVERRAGTASDAPAPWRPAPTIS